MLKGERERQTNWNLNIPLNVGVLYIQQTRELSSFINISGSNNKFKLCMKIGDNIWKFFIGVVISIAATTLTSVIVTFATSTSKTEQETGRNMKSLLLCT